MDQKVKELLQGQGENYIFPFFWQHGEEEDVLRKYMEVIDQSNIKAVCVESRPHPDFCGEKWWKDMDVILSEARARGMKVWILDDSHFPTGFANGAMAHQPDTLCRQSISCHCYPCAGKKELVLEGEALTKADAFVPTEIEKMIGEKNARTFCDDGLLAVVARSSKGETIDLTGQITDKRLTFSVPEGDWKVYTIFKTRNLGYRRNYINMMSMPSCKVLIDAVYEKHYEHYKDDFGTVIAGFFSDEPELGNGHLYEQDLKFGENPGMDYPWSDELEALLTKTLGQDFADKLFLLWEKDASADEKAAIRYAYMDGVTKLVKQDFSMQLGEWCRSHGVKYIGHLIEDNGMHARTGSSLGHYFRGLAGQDMSGIDDIGGQVFPQGEDISYDKGAFQRRNGEFYHYMLGKLGSSMAAIDPLKHGDSMCEIFGAYGWGEGVRLEKYLVDHFLVRGINHYVPHAFSAKEFPDPDCPPHFYAQGHNPQYRHFGSLMSYTNRLCHLIAGGKHVAPIALLYHGEAEWTGDCMPGEQVAHILADHQMDYDFIPQDVFADRSSYQTHITKDRLQILQQEYRAFVVPQSQYITQALAEALVEMKRCGFPVYIIETFPQGICDGTASPQEKQQLLAALSTGAAIPLDSLKKELLAQKRAELVISPENSRIRYYHYENPQGNGVLLFVNEGTEVYQGTVHYADTRTAYGYDAWNNCLKEVSYDGEKLSLTIAPLESVVVILDQDAGALENKTLQIPWNAQAKKELLETGWKRSVCNGIAYPAFADEKNCSLPDSLAEEMPEFSGFVRYETEFSAAEGERIGLLISDAHEGVEVFVNGKSLGIQIVPEYRYDLSEALQKGTNQLVIEVATTLERQMAKIPNMFGQKSEAISPSGINGMVSLLRGI